MTSLHNPRGGIAARWIAVVGISVLFATPLAPVTEGPPPPPTIRDVRLTAVAVPPGGLIGSFLGNQVVYCSIICPLVVQTAATAAATTVLSPLTLLTAPRSNDPLRALGAAVASVTGPTNAAAQATIFADGTRVAPRALNAVEVAVLGLLNIVPAAANGLPGIADAVQRFREQTYAALNLPIVPNPEPTVRPRGVLQVAVVETINVGASVIFPAFNHILSAVFETPDAMAQELAATGDPIRALVAGIDTAARRLVAAGTVVAEAVVTAVRNIGTAIDESRTGHRVPPRGTEASADVPTDTDVTTKAVEPGDDTDPGAASATSSPTPKVGDATHADRRHQNAGSEGHKRASRHSPSSTENDESPLGERLSSHDGTKHHDSGDGAQVSRQRRIDDTGVRAH